MRTSAQVTNSDKRTLFALLFGHEIGLLDMRIPVGYVILLIALLGTTGFCEDPSDPILDLLLQKGIVSEAEVQKAKAETELRFLGNRLLSSPACSR